MKKIVILISFLLSITAANAQKSNTYECEKGHYINFGIGGGLQSLLYDLQDYGNKKLGWGGAANLNYSYFFTRHWGVGTGLSLKTLAASAKLNSVQTIENAVDEDGYSYSHLTYFNNLKEKQNQILFGVPITLCYQYNVGNRWKLSGSLGAAWMSPIKDKFKTTKGDLETRGFYPEYNLELYGMEQHHFYTADDFKGNNNIGNSWAGLAEIGVLYALSKRWDLSFSVNGVFGISNQASGNSDANIYNPDCMSADAYKNPVYNGILSSGVIDKLRSMSTSLSVGLRYKLEHKKKEKPQDPDIPTDNPIIVDNNKGLDSIPNVDTISQIDDDIEVMDSMPDTVPAIVNNEPENKDIEPNKKVENNPKVRDIIIQPNFELNKYQSQNIKDYYETIDSLAVMLKENPDMHIEIVGHTCDLGSELYNQQLGQSRANFVRQELIKRGVPSKQVVAMSKGETEPLVPNTSEENRKKNRRVEIKIVTE